jgi:hypothetical protein
VGNREKSEIPLEATLLVVAFLRETIASLLTPALAKNHEERANALKQKYPNLSSEVVRALDEHIANQKAVLRKRGHRK